jgi:hypothetical protein
LQRRLRIGYGRAAHLIDLMERDGIVGAADGPKPRELLKRPDWQLDLGRWQQVFYAEFDGQRDKRILIKVMGE